MGLLRRQRSRSLNLTHLTIAAGAKLTVLNWVNAVDYSYSTNSPGATVLNRVEFSGFTTIDTQWPSYDRQITPVPEPSAYGAVFAGVLFALYG